MANVHKVTNWVAMDTLDTLKATGTLHPSFNTDYNKELTQEFPVDSEFQVKLPFRFLIRDGEQRVSRDVTRKFVPVTMEQPFGIDFAYTQFEAALKMDRSERMLRKEFTAPAGEQLGSEMDSRLAKQAYERIPNIVGVLGTDPTTINTYHLMGQRLEEFGCHPGEKRLYITPSMSSALMNTAATYFHPNTDVEDMWRNGNLGMLSGAKSFRSVRLWQHTTGVVTTAASLTMAASSVNGATTILINCTSGDTFKKNERICIAASFNVHPQTRRKFGSALANQAVYIVQADVTATGATCTLTLDRAIYGPGDPNQNVDALPLINALVTRWPGTTIADGSAVTGTVGVCLHRNALGLVGAKLEMPKAVETSISSRDPETGLQLSIVGQYDNEIRKIGYRMDMWAGYGGFYPANDGVCVLGL